MSGTGLVVIGVMWIQIYFLMRVAHRLDEIFEKLGEDDDPNNPRHRDTESHP